MRNQGPRCTGWRLLYASWVCEVGGIATSPIRYTVSDEAEKNKLLYRLLDRIFCKWQIQH